MFSLEGFFFSLVGVIVSFISFLFFCKWTYIFSINTKIKSINEYATNTLFKSQIQISVSCRLQLHKNSRVSFSQFEFPAHKPCSSVQWRSYVTGISCYIHVRYFVHARIDQRQRMFSDTVKSNGVFQKEISSTRACTM